MQTRCLFVSLFVLIFVRSSRCDVVVVVCTYLCEAIGVVHVNTRCGHILVQQKIIHMRRLG